MNITGTCKVWCREYAKKDGGTFKKYTIGVGKKTEEGNYVNAYQPVRFRKGVDVSNGTSIDVKNAFATVNSYVNNEGKQVNTVEWMILDFDVIGSEAEQSFEQGFAQLVDNDVPF